MNELLLDWINGLAGRSGLVDGLGEFGAKDGIFVLAAVVAMLGLVELRRNFRRGLAIGVVGVAAVGLSLAMAVALGQVVTEARPFVADGDTVKLISHGADNSFPSDHATVAAAIAVAAALAWRRWAVVVVALALFVGFSRVFVGVHYPGDVAAGWALGATAAGVCWLAAKTLAPRLAVT
jgi:membrane-associated phospholipid phosphatase